MDFSLSARLKTVADLVPGCNTLADIGTDHGFLPFYLLQQHRIQNAICTDINKGPLSTARAHWQQVATQFPEAQVSFRLGDGLSVINDGEADCCVIAGMGGDLISRIIRNIPKGIATFIFQPMTKAERLRAALFQRGWNTTEWRLVQDNSFIYEVLLCHPSSSSENRSLPPVSEAAFFAAPPNPQTLSLYGAYIARKKEKVHKILAGLQEASGSFSYQRKIWGQTLFQLESFEQDFYRINSEKPHSTREVSQCPSTDCSYLTL